MRSARAITAGVLAVAALAATGAVTSGEAATVAPRPAAAPTSRPNVLLAGEHLTYKGPRSSLHAGDFDLLVSPDFLELDQTIPLHGKQGSTSINTGTWFVDDGTGEHQTKGDRTTLSMRRDGNLVLATSKGVRLWSSRTEGTGRYNRLVLGAGGNLAIFTSSGKIVWSSHSGRVYLGPGSTLGSGQKLIDAYNPRGYKAQTLTMQTDGNLVRRCGDHVLWQTGTRGRGAVLRMNADGGLSIRTPSGRTLWYAKVTSHSTYAYFDMREVEIRRADYSNKVLWSSHYPYYPC